jgi:hypothetical protein
MNNYDRQKNIVEQNLRNIYKSEENDLEKGGAGSKGGKIVGYTTSGKPIYASSKAQEHKTYTPQEQKEVSDHHDNVQRGASIGKTRSGKDIHSHRSNANQWSNPTRDKDLKSYSKEDHEDAKEAHTKLRDEHREKAKKASDEGKDAAWYKHDQAAYKHDSYAKEHENSAKRVEKSESDNFLEKGGAGSRGGKIIGYTKGGHAIYESGTEGRKFTPDNLQRIKDMHDKLKAEGYNNDAIDGAIANRHQNLTNKQLDEAYHHHGILDHAEGNTQKPTYSHKKATAVKKSESEDLSAPHLHQQLIKSRIAQCFKADSPQVTTEELEKSADNFLEKGGKRAVIGERRTFGGREYIKTSAGWKFHGKGGGAKAIAHREGALDHHVEAGKGEKKDTTKEGDQSTIKDLEREAGKTHSSFADNRDRGTGYVYDISQDGQITSSGNLRHNKKFKTPELAQEYLKKQGFTLREGLPKPTSKHIGDMSLKEKKAAADKLGISTEGKTVKQINKELADANVDKAIADFKEKKAIQFESADALAEFVSDSEEGHEVLNDVLEDGETAYWLLYDEYMLKTSKGKGMKKDGYSEGDIVRQLQDEGDYHDKASDHAFKKIYAKIKGAGK